MFVILGRECLGLLFLLGGWGLEISLGAVLVRVVVDEHVPSWGGILGDDGRVIRDRDADVAVAAGREEEGLGACYGETTCRGPPPAPLPTTM